MKEKEQRKIYSRPPLRKRSFRFRERKKVKSINKRKLKTFRRSKVNREYDEQKRIKKRRRKAKANLSKVLPATLQFTRFIGFISSCPNSFQLFVCSNRQALSSICQLNSSSDTKRFHPFTITLLQSQANNSSLPPHLTKLALLQVHVLSYDKRKKKNCHYK